MVSIDHAFKIAYRVFTDGAKIDMDKHDDADGKAGNDVKQVGQIEPAEAKKTVYSDIRVEKAPARKDDKGNQHIHQEHVGGLLQGVELALFAYREGRIFIFEKPDGVIVELFLKTDQETPDRDNVMCAICRKQVPDKKDRVTYG